MIREERRAKRAGHKKEKESKRKEREKAFTVAINNRGSGSGR